MAKGSNELNALLKAKVVQIRAELDVKGSLPKIKSQIDEITKLLEKKPVKLKAELDYKNSNMSSQVDGLIKKLENKHLKLKVKFDVTASELKDQFKQIEGQVTGSKSFKPIKIGVEIDVKGSADAIKKQLQDVHQTVEAFNKKYGKQLAQMQQKAQKAQQSNAKVMQNAGSSPTPVPTNGAVGGFNFKLYASQLKDAEQQMRGMFGKGLFSSHEMKDAEGNLQGFIASLQKANGVVQKIHYQWNAEKSTFVPISQQTITNMEKQLHQAKQNLQSTYADIEKLKKGKGKDALFQEFDSLEKRASHGTLTADAVKNLQRMIKEEGVLQQQIKQSNSEILTQEKLVNRLDKAMDKDFKRTNNVDRRNQFKDVRNKIQQDPENLQKYAFELQKINDEISKEIQKEKQLQANLNKKNKILKELHDIERLTVSDDHTSQTLIAQVKALTQLASKGKDWIEIQKKMNSLKSSNKNAEDLRKIAILEEKSLDKLQKLKDRGKLTDEKFERAKEHVALNASRGFADLDRFYETVSRKLERVEKQQKRIQADGILKHGIATPEDQAKSAKLQSIVKSGDIMEVQRYIEKLYKAKVETIALKDREDTLGRSVTELQVKMKGAGKTVKEYTLQMENANGTLRQTGQALSFNANRNLGVFEQLKIAMARVPVWMASMTTFYGSIRTLQNFGQEILKVDKSMTELKRVASDNINIETVFEGAVALSAELGNNIHDIMGAVNDLARTYGDFNERQLIAVARTATLMSNVSDLSVEEATNSLVGTMNAFNIEAEDSIRIVDSLNEVDNDYAISTKQLAEGLSKSASTAKTFGIQLEESIGHITAIGAVTMESGAIIGNSLKTIYSRITTIDDAKGALEGVKVGLYEIGQTGEKQVKPVSKILGDLADKWTGLSKEQQQNIAVTVAGRYQLSRFLALMNNWDTATQATETALTSQGSAIRENGKYMESFEARINKLKNAFTALALSVGDSVMNSSMMVIIEGLSSLAKVAVEIVDKFGALPIILGVVGLLVGGMSKFRVSISSTKAYLSLLRAEMVATAGSATGLRGAFLGLSGGMKGVVTLLPTMTGGLKGLRVAFAGLVSSTIVGIAFVALGFAIEKLIGIMAKQKAIAEKTAKVNKQLIDSYRNTEGGLENLINEQARLQDAFDSGAIEKGTQAYLDYVAVTNKLAEKMPSIVKYVDQSGLAHLRETEAIKEQLGYAKQLSEAKGKKDLASFDTNISKQMKKYDDELKKIKKLEAEKAKLRKEDGKDQYISSGVGLIKTGLKNENKDDVQQKNIEIINGEMEKQKIIQKTMGVVQQTSMAYLESEGQLKNLTDSGITVVENMVQQNEELLRYHYEGTTKVENSTAQITKNADQLFNLSKDIGGYISNTYESMTKGVTDPMKLKDIKSNMDNLINALPKNFFTLDSLNSIDDVKEKFQGVLSIADQVKAGSGDFSNLTDSLEKIGFTSDDAKKYVAKLGIQYNNTEIKSKALTQAQNEGSESLQDWVDTAIKAIDTSEALFGVNDEDVSALKSHVETLQSMTLMYGENAKESQKYQESLEKISLFLGVPEEAIAKDLDYYHNVLDLMGKVELQYDKNTGKLIGFNKEGLNKNQIAMLDRMIYLGKEHGAEIDNLTEKTYKLKDGVELVKDAQGNLVSKVKATNDELGKSTVAHGQKDVIEEIGKSADETKYKVSMMRKEELFNKEDTSADKVVERADGVRKTLKDIQERAYKLKQEQIFGDEKNADTTKQKVDKVGESAEVASQKLDNYNRKQKEIFDQQGKDGAGSKDKAKIDELTEAIKKSTNSAKLLNTLDGAIDKSTKKLNSLFEKVKSISSGIGKIGGKSNNISVNVKAVANAYESLIAKSDKASSKVKQAIDSQKKALSGLKKSATEAKTTMNDAFTSMASTVAKKTSAMITQHKNQKTAINNLKDASKKAREAVNDLNSAIAGSMGSLDSYMTKAKNAQVAGNSLPSIDGGVEVNSISKLTGGVSYGGDSVAGALSTMASIGSGTTGGDSGTSGTIVQPKPVFVGARTLDGGYDFHALAVKNFNVRDYSGGESSSAKKKKQEEAKKKAQAKSKAKKDKAKKKTSKNTKEELEQLYTWNALERQANALSASISLLEARMGGLTQNTVGYRDSLKSVISLSNQHLAVLKKDLTATEKRNKAILKITASYGSTKTHTKSERENYNKLMQEYDSNLSKINSLRTDIASLAIDIRNKSLEIFTNFIDQVVENYDKAITKIKDGIDDIDFNIQVLELTDPDNKKELINKHIEKATKSKQSQATTQNKVDTLEDEYTKESKKQGALNAKDEKTTLEAEKKKQASLNKKRADIIKKAQAKYNADVKKYGKNSKQAKASKTALDKATATDKKVDASDKKRIADLTKKYNLAIASGANSASAKKALEELNKAKEELEDATIETLQAEKEIRDIRLSVANDGIDALKDYYGKMKDMATDAIETQIELETKAHDAKMKRFDEEVDGINAIYDAKFKKMDEQKAKESYEEELADKNKKKAELVNKISLLSRDNSLEGKKKLAELQKELADVNKDLSDFQENRADQLVRDSLEQQKQDQIDKINGGYDENGKKIEGTKEKEQELFDTRMENLQKQKDEVSKFYDDIINNETHWQQIRDDAQKGSFTLLNTEMTKMGTNIETMQKGIFDGLFTGFAQLSEEVKKHVAEIQALTVDNLTVGTGDAINGVKGANGSNGYVDSNGVVSGGSKPSTPNQTTPHGYKMSAGTNIRQTTGAGKDIVIAVPTNAVVDMISYGKDWSKIKYKGKTGYVSSKYVKKFDTGGYTGDWAGNEGKIAMLHKKEIVLKENDTKNLLDTVKIMDKVKSIIPALKQKIPALDLANAGGMNITNNYDLTVNIDSLTGDKNGADIVVKEIMKGLKKRGK